MIGQRYGMTVCQTNYLALHLITMFQDLKDQSRCSWFPETNPRFYVTCSTETVRKLYVVIRKQIWAGCFPMSIYLKWNRSNLWGKLHTENPKPTQCDMKYQMKVKSTSEVTNWSSLLIDSWNPCAQPHFPWRLATLIRCMKLAWNKPIKHCRSVFHRFWDAGLLIFVNQEKYTLFCAAYSL